MYVRVILEEKKTRINANADFFNSQRNKYLISAYILEKKVGTRI